MTAAPAAGQDSRAGAITILAALDLVVLDCLAKNPAARPQTLASRLADVPLVRAWGEAEAAQWWALHRSTVVGLGN